MSVHDENFWLTCESPFEVLRAFELLRDARRTLLWVVGCCRISGPLSDGGLSALDTAEQYADGWVTVAEMTAAHEAAQNELAANCEEVRALDGELLSLCVEVDLGRAGPDATAGVRARLADAGDRRMASDRVATATDPDLRSATYRWINHYETQPETTEILRCVFPNPFRAVRPEAAWRTDTVLALATQMCASHEFSAMPILADALQDAGCENEQVLAHCRRDGSHVCGCWVMDLILGKE